MSDSYELLVVHGHKLWKYNLLTGSIVLQCLIATKC